MVTRRHTCGIKHPAATQHYCQCHETQQGNLDSSVCRGYNALSDHGYGLWDPPCVLAQTMHHCHLEISVFQAEHGENVALHPTMYVMTSARCREKTGT